MRQPAFITNEYIPFRYDSVRKMGGSSTKDSGEHGPIACARLGNIRTTASNLTRTRVQRSLLQLVMLVNSGP